MGIPIVREIEIKSPSIASYALHYCFIPPVSKWRYEFSPQDFTNYIRVFGQFESCLHLQKEGNVIAFNLVSLVEYLGRFHACLDTLDMC